MCAGKYYSNAAQYNKLQLIDSNLGLFGLLNESSLLGNSDEEWWESVKRQGGKEYLTWDTKKPQSDVYKITNKSIY